MNNHNTVSPLKDRSTAKRQVNRMRRIIITITLCMALLLAGCQSQSGAPRLTDVLPAASASAVDQSTTDPIEETVSAQPPMTDDGSVRARMNAPETLTHTFSSNTGKTQVMIDAVVEVPDVSKVHLYEVTAREIPTENITAFADHIIGTGAWSGDKKYNKPEKSETNGGFDGVTSENMFISSLKTNERGWSIYDIEAYATRQNGIFRGLQGLNFISFLGSGFRYNSSMTHERHGMDARNCEYSYTEALALAQEAAAILAPELTVVSGGVISGDESEAYLFCFTRNVDGIPVTYTTQACGYYDEDENGDPIIYRIIYPYESLRLVVDSQGLVDGRYESPYVLSDPIETDVELLTFDQVLEITENILPLTFTWLEDTYHIKVEIDRISFGYTRLDFKDDMYRYKLVPVWDFFGTYYYYRDGELVGSYTDDYNSLLTINAIDGTVIDRRYGY